MKQFFDKIKSLVAGPDRASAETVRPKGAEWTPAPEGLRNAYDTSRLQYLGPAISEMKRGEDIPKSKYELFGNQYYFGMRFRPEDPDPTSPKLRERRGMVDSINSTYDYLDRIAEHGDRGTTEEEVNKHLRNISIERKIHLQPKKQFLGLIVNRLMKMVAEYPELRQAITAIKMSTESTPYTDESGVYPEVVVYTYGKQNFEKALQAILPYFQEYEKYSNGIAPRMNQKVSELVYVAQSGGDVKKTLKRSGLLDTFFDPATNHAFLRGEGLDLKTLKLKSQEKVPTVQAAQDFDQVIRAVEYAPNYGTQRRRQQITQFIGRFRKGLVEFGPGSKLPLELIAKLQELKQMETHRKSIRGAG